jgi:hypothetical protein
MTQKTHTLVSKPPSDVRKQKVLGVFVRHWAAAAFSAAMTIVLEHLGFLQLFTKLSWLVLFSLPAAVPETGVNFQPGMPAVVLITEADFVTRYGEKTPLDRCVLAADIQKVLAKSPQRLAIDFDLSPMLGSNAMDELCQQHLDSLLDEHSQKLIVLVPFVTANKALLEKKHAWMEARCQAGLAFADGQLDTAMGMVTEHTVGEGADLKARIAEQMREGPSDFICKQVTKAGAYDANPWLNELRRKMAAETNYPSVPLHFNHAITQLGVIPLHSDALDGVPSFEGSPVLFGGHWGRDDNFLTNAGEQCGAVVHGVRVVNLAYPVNMPAPLIALLMDMAIAVGFAWLVKFFWSVYVDSRKLDHHYFKNGHKVEFGALILFGFVLAYVCLTLFFTFAAHDLLARFSLVMVPILIAMSMLLDGFVSGPVEKIDALLEDKSSTPRSNGCLDADPELSREKTRVMNSLMWMFGLCVAFVLLVGVGGVQVAVRFSGTVFIAGLVIFYLVLITQTLIHAQILFRHKTGGLQRVAAFLGRASDAVHVLPISSNDNLGKDTDEHTLKQNRVGMSPMIIRLLTAIGRVASVLKKCAFWGVLATAVCLQIGSL